MSNMLLTLPLNFTVEDYSHSTGIRNKRWVSTVRKLVLSGEVMNIFSG